jgi:hypothetical protein
VDRQTDRQTDSSKAICLPFFEGGHKNTSKHVQRMNRLMDIKGN